MVVFSVLIALHSICVIYSLLRVGFHVKWPNFSFFFLLFLLSINSKHWLRFFFIRFCWWANSQVRTSYVGSIHFSFFIRKSLLISFGFRMGVNSTTTLCFFFQEDTKSILIHLHFILCETITNLLSSDCLRFTHQVNLLKK